MECWVESALRPRHVGGSLPAVGALGRPQQVLSALIDQPKFWCNMKANFSLTERRNTRLLSSLRSAGDPDARGRAEKLLECFLGHESETQNKGVPFSACTARTFDAVLARLDREHQCRPRCLARLQERAKLSPWYHHGRGMRATFGDTWYCMGELTRQTSVGAASCGAGLHFQAGCPHRPGCSTGRRSRGELHLEWGAATA